MKLGLAFEKWEKFEPDFAHNLDLPENERMSCEVRSLTSGDAIVVNSHDLKFYKQWWKSLDEERRISPHPEIDTEEVVGALQIESWKTIYLLETYSRNYCNFEFEESENGGVLTVSDPVKLFFMLPNSWERREGDREGREGDALQNLIDASERHILSQISAKIWSFRNPITEAEAKN